MTPTILIDLPIMTRLDHSTKSGQVALYNMVGTLETEDPMPKRAVGGELSVLDLNTNTKIPIATRPFFWKGGKCRFKISLTLFIGSIYTIQVVYSGEPQDSQVAEPLGPAVSDPIPWDLTT
jgi:hypothetical protein